MFFIKYILITFSPPKSFSPPCIPNSMTSQPLSPFPNLPNDSQSLQRNCLNKCDSLSSSLLSPSSPPTIHSSELLCGTYCPQEPGCLTVTSPSCILQEDKLSAPALSLCSHIVCAPPSVQTSPTNGEGQ